MSQIIIDYRFTSLNDYISAERTNRHIAAKIKRDETEIARVVAKEKLDNGFPAVKVYPVDVTFLWFRKDARTDPDNIAFGEKFILDGLVLAGVLKGDGWYQIANIRHEFTLSNRDYVIVDID